MQRLNMDNSWFIQFNDWKILVDPWLEGTEVDFFSWFNTQWHRTTPIAFDQVPDYDTVLITQKYPDHFHEKTIKKLKPKHIIAPSSLHKKLITLFPEATIISLDKNNTKTGLKGVELTFLPTKRKIDPIYDAFILDDGKDSIFLATHGFQLDNDYKTILQNISSCKLLLTPFNLYKLPFFLGGVVSPGLNGVQHLCEVLQPKKVIATHDEDKHAKGLVSKFAKIIRPESKDSLLTFPWLSNRYLEINHYEPTIIS